MATQIEIHGYHGTTVESAKTIMNEGFEHSREDYDWLGDGIYFWQDAPERAWQWAEKKADSENEKPAVVGTKINFSIGKQEGPLQYIDLLDIPWEDEIADTFNGIHTLYRAVGQSLPRQTKGAHRLDHMVIDELIEHYETARRITIAAVRSAFQEGEPIFQESDTNKSALHTLTHVQLAVRKEEIIFDKWIERGKVR